MGVTLKFVKGAYLSTYDKKVPRPDKHVVQMDYLLRITSRNKPPVAGLTEVDLHMDALAYVKRVRISLQPPCINDDDSLKFLHEDTPLNPAASLISVEVIGGKFSYPHSMVSLPKIPNKEKPFGWIQVDFERGTVGVELFSDGDVRLASFSVYDGQAFDIAGYIMYQSEACALDEELLAQAAGGGPTTFKVLEQGDGTGYPKPPS